MNINSTIEVLKKYYENPLIKESFNGESFLSYDVEVNGEVIFGIDDFEDDSKKLLDFWDRKNFSTLTKKISPDLYEKLSEYKLKIESAVLTYTGFMPTLKKETLEEFISEHYYDRPYLSYSININGEDEKVLIYISVHFEITDTEIKPLFYISFGGVKNNDYHYIDFNDEESLLSIIFCYFNS